MTAYTFAVAFLAAWLLAIGNVAVALYRRARS